MMKLKNLKKSLIASVGIIAAFATATIINVAKVDAWGPTDRPTYTNEKPADYATFNSITNNAAVGDERNFVRIREAGTEDIFGDEVEVIPGHEYEVWIYYHNNAATDTNASGVGVATNVRVSTAYPTVVNTGERGMISGIIDWSYVTPQDPNNAKQGSVWDEAYVTSKTDGVVLRYKTGTALIHNGGKANGTVLPEAIFTKEGTPIGYNKLTGTLPGCAEYSGHITYTLVAEKTEATITKQVSLDGENWADSVKAKPGEFVTYKVQFKNVGNTNLTNVIFKDVHDEDLLLRSGSIKVYDVDNVDGKTIDDILDISGYNAGDALNGALIQIIYQMQVREGVSACGKNLQNTITASYNSTENISGTTTVQVEECATPPPSIEDCKTNPSLPGCDTPDVIPETGPLQIALAVIVALGIAAGGFYFWRTRHTLKAVKSSVTGPTDGGVSIGNTPMDSAASTDSTPIAPASFSTPAESAPETPEAPQTPETPEAQEAPEAPSAPENPETPEIPSAPEAPETPETPADGPSEPTPEGN